MNREENHSDKNRFGLKSRLTVCFVSIVSALFIAEMAVRWSEVNDHFTRRIFSKNLLRTSSNPILIYENKPGGFSTIDGVENKINRQGFRDKEYDPVKPRDVFRIIALGDSITYGLGVRWDETYPKILEQQLNERFEESNRRFEVLNFGVNGYNTVQEVEHFRVNGLKYDPDLIVVGYNLNDVGNYSREMPYFNTWRNKTWQYEETSKDRFVSFILQHSELAFMIKYRTLQMHLDHWLDSRRETGENISLRPIDFFRVTYTIEKEIERLNQAFADLQQLGRIHDFPILMVIFPILCDFDKYLWTDLHRKVAGLAESSGFAVLDLLETYQSTRQPATRFQRRPDDFDHPNADGHRLSAQAIARRLHSVPAFDRYLMGKPPIEMRAGSGFDETR
ncbi:SGNH/GDSL hydrolase family protein [bacterium]|nr:SGNH/GDSL hydrolase family protein [candidate division CSSED10-310 bacterium]